MEFLEDNLSDWLEEELQVGRRLCPAYSQGRCNPHDAYRLVTTPPTHPTGLRRG